MAYDPDLDVIFDQIRATINTKAAQADLDTFENILGELKEQYLALKAEVDKLKAQQPPTPGPTGPTGPPIKGETYFGYTYSAGPISGVDAITAKGLKKPKILRMFTGGNSPSGLNEKDLIRTDCAKWVSWKPNPDTQMPKPETWAPQAVSNLKSRVPKAVPVYMTVWHEPEGTDDRGSHSLSAWIKIWQNAQAALYDECVKARSEGYKFYVAPIICDWTFTDTTKGSAAQWYSADFIKYDVMGFDVYPVGQKADGKNMIARMAMEADYKPLPYADPKRRDTYSYVLKCAELAKQRNKPWGSGETGIIAGKERGGDSLYKYTLAQRAQRFNDIRAHITSLENPPLLWAWWHHDSCNVTSQNPVDTDGIAAFNASIDGSPTGLPVI